MRISVVNQQTDHKWNKSWDSLIRKAVNYIGKLRKLPAPTEVNLIIVDKAYIQELNYIYRRIDNPTDVLSFSMNEIRDEEPHYEAPEEDHMMGDIVICLDIALSQAEEYGHSVERELVFLTVHGMLHLLGYDHEEEGERALMRSLEDKIMDGLGLAR
ncbi:MAG: rRNA maturation RNase YbeY [Candidatus Saccharibacteria bacterium]